MARRSLFLGVILVLLFGAACNAVVSRPTTSHSRTYQARIVAETEVGALYRQGVARVRDGWVFSFNDGLFVTNDDLIQTKQLLPAIPAEWKALGFNHIGDIDVEAGVLYAPLEQPDYARGRQALLTYDASSLAYTGGRFVSQHENSFVTVDRAKGVAYSMDRFGGDALLRYDLRDDWRPLPPLEMSAFVDRVQGADIARGAVWLSTDDAIDGVYRVDLRSGEVTSLGSIGHVDGEGEGIDAMRSRGDVVLRVLSIDVALAPVRLIDMRVTRFTDPYGRRPPRG